MQYIYGLAVLSADSFATSSEDRTVKIFKDGQCVQVNEVARAIVLMSPQRTVHV